MSEAEEAKESTTDECTAVSDVENTSQNVESEGRHMKLLRTALQKTASKGVSAGRLSVFAKAYQPLFDANPKAVKAIHTQFAQQLEENIDDELATMIEEENIITLCNQLDNMMEAAPKEIAEPMWRPSGDPEVDVRDHVMPLKLAHKERLRSYLTELENESKKLQERVAKSKRKLGEVQKTVKEKSTLLDENTKLCDKKSLDQMKTFISGQATN